MYHMKQVRHHIQQAQDHHLRPGGVLVQPEVTVRLHSKHQEVLRGQHLRVQWMVRLEWVQQVVRVRLEQEWQVLVLRHSSRWWLHRCSHLFRHHIQRLDLQKKLFDDKY